MIISDDIYLRTEKGVKKLDVSAERWPGSTCRLLLDNIDTILKIAIKDHGSGEMNEDVYAEALAVWEALFLFNDAVTRGCDDTEPVAGYGSACAGIEQWAPNVWLHIWRWPLTLT
jgi:hypothetical protein